MNFDNPSHEETVALVACPVCKAGVGEECIRDSATYNKKFGVKRNHVQRAKAARHAKMEGKS